MSRSQCPAYWAEFSNKENSVYKGRYRFYTSRARDAFVRRAERRIAAAKLDQSVVVGKDDYKAMQRCDHTIGAYAQVKALGRAELVAVRVSTPDSLKRAATVRYRFCPACGNSLGPDRIPSKEEEAA